MSLVSVAQLSLLLHSSNGVTGSFRSGEQDWPLRAAPSAGANYAGEVYLVAERVRGLTPGLYYYGVARHRLVQLRRGSLLSRVARSLEDPRATDGAAFAVLLTNVFSRYTRQYANRGYRYALIDSGHIGENLRLAAGALGCAEQSPRRFWDDALNRLLDVDGRREAVCAIHIVGHPGAIADANSSERAIALEESQFAEAPSEEGSDIERFHHATTTGPRRLARLA